MITWGTFLRCLAVLLGLSGVKARELPRVKAGGTRRQFLRAMGVSAGALATLSIPLDLDVPLAFDAPMVGRSGPFNLEEAAKILKEIYVLAVREMIIREGILSQFLLKGGKL